MKHARTSDWVRTRRYDEPSKDLVRSSLRQSCPDCIIATHGYSVIVRGGLLDLRLELTDAPLDVGLLARTVHDRRVFLGDDYLLRLAQHFEGDVLELDAELLADQLAP